MQSLSPPTEERAMACRGDGNCVDTHPVITGESSSGRRHQIVSADRQDAEPPGELDGAASGVIVFSPASLVGLN